MFTLDERLKNDSVLVGDFPLSLLLMSRDANYPWFILVPKREGMTELYQLDEVDMAQFTAESRHLSQTLMSLFDGDKLNVAALGNVVAQLHIHHIVRYTNDVAWPRPVWGAETALSYTEEELKKRIQAVQSRLEEGFVGMMG